MEEQKNRWTNSKLKRDLNTTISIINLDINGLNILIKDTDFQVGF